MDKLSSTEATQTREQLGFVKGDVHSQPWQISMISPFENRYKPPLYVARGTAHLGIIT